MAKKTIPNRTFTPLHFEDLEPHRFEDLVRQLTYDFREWAQLEATGRTGSDHGFDARGFEAVATSVIGNEEEDEDDAGEHYDHRLWLIQCKREKTITPKKLRDYLEDVNPTGGQPLHGLIFAAACDFSIKARDDFRTKVRDLGITEAYLWGKAEIEDMLYQPKNDHLLFAYFGISLQVRKRSLKTEIRSRLATKRKAHKVIGLYSNPILVRDPSDDRYPRLDRNKELDRVVRGRWFPYTPDGCRHDGIHIVRYKQFAYVADDGNSWDFAELMNDAELTQNDNPWHRAELNDVSSDQLLKEHEARMEAFEIWNKLEDRNKGWFEQYVVLPYDKILAIDEDGDEFFKGTHIYVEPFTQLEQIFAPYWLSSLTNVGIPSRTFKADEEKRIEFFPRHKSE